MVELCEAFGRNVSEGFGNPSEFFFKVEKGAYEFADKKRAPFPREVRTSLLKGAHFLPLNLPTFSSPLAQRRHFCCATEHRLLRNGATFVAQQKSAPPPT